MYLRLLYIFCLVAVFPLFAHGAEIRLEPSNEFVYEGDYFTLDIVVSTEDAMNAIEATIALDSPTIARFDGVALGASHVSFWVDEPEVSSDGTHVELAGVIPGGIVGPRIFIASIRVQAQSEGVVYIEPEAVRAHAHDGEGTELNLTVRPTSVLVRSGASGAYVSDNEIDTEPPEDFVPVRVVDPYLNGGLPSIVFSTHDKGSGIARYEIKEGLVGFYRMAQSPYVIDGNNDARVHIRAIDRAGNIRTVVVGDDSPLALWYVFGILAILCICMFLVWRTRSSFFS